MGYSPSLKRRGFMTANKCRAWPWRCSIMSIKLHGKEYVEVKDRVAAAHAEESYSMLREETFSMGGREYVRVYVDVKGKQYIGTAECKYNASPKSPDGMS